MGRATILVDVNRRSVAGRLASAAWPAIAVVVIHSLLSAATGHVRTYDPIFHVVGGAAGAYFIMRIASDFRAQLGPIASANPFVLVLGGMLVVTLGWELLEFVGNSVRGRQPRIRLETVMDVVLGMAGAFSAVVWAGIRVRRVFFDGPNPHAHRPPNPSEEKPMFLRLPGLPAYGALARPFPAGWGHGAREGVVVEFVRSDGSTWVGNFEPGLDGIDQVRLHPNGVEVLVAAAGRLWSVNPVAEEATCISVGVVDLWELTDPPRLLLNYQDLAFLCVGREGVLWATPRISLDGFQKLRLTNDTLEGEALSIGDAWSPFRVNLADGRFEGKGWGGPHMTFDFADFRREPR